MTEMFDLGGRVAAVTGGNGGIGLGMARGLAQAGAAVMVAGRNEDKNAAAVAELTGLGAEADSVVLEVTEAASCQAMVAAKQSPTNFRLRSNQRLNDPGNTTCNEDAAKVTNTNGTAQRTES